MVWCYRDNRRRALHLKHTHRLGQLTHRGTPITGHTAAELHGSGCQLVFARLDAAVFMQDWVERVQRGGPRAAWTRPATYAWVPTG